MTDALSSPPSPFPAPAGSEVAVLPRRLAQVSAVLVHAQAALGEVSATTWQSVSATRFLELVGNLRDDITATRELLGCAEQELTAFLGAVDGAEQAIAAIRVAQ